MELKKETQEFLSNLDEDDVKNLTEILEDKRHRKWVYGNISYLIKGTVFLISAWIAFETFLKQHLFKLFH